MMFLFVIGCAVSAVAVVALVSKKKYF